MKKDILFSVIMPVYKVEQYLRKAIKSVLQQTYSNFELILVDDCSPDLCGNICDEFAAADSRIRVVHKPKNEGLGFARNTGLSVCKGQYVLFMDSDDWIEKDTLLKAASYLEEELFSVLAFGFSQDYLNKDGQIVKKSLVRLESCIAELPHDIACAAIKMDMLRNFAYAWSKIYSLDFLKENHLLFDDTKLMEDFVFNISVFAKAEKIKLTEDVFYHYIRPAHETLASVYDPIFFDLCKMRYNKEYELLNNSGVQDQWYYQAIRDIYIKHIFSVAVRDQNKKQHLKIKEKYIHISTVLNDKQTIEILKQSKTNAKAIGVLQMIFKYRWVLCTMLLARIYSVIQNLRHR